ncbi:hypothetical protein Pan97_05780 [Bremerella volcania]|uniref:Uncharacterized protein n=1 Tax=Bremerella volcania TaxID=2527984 RepID=A0A518C301_9BACT|nr:hypothetical protein Pan97_05780 [Bremerella volcania]
MFLSSQEVDRLAEIVHNLEKQIFLAFAINA